MKALVLFLLLFTAGISFGQQDPLVTSEGQRSFWFNPATIGTFNKLSINSVGRKQWVNISNSPALIQLNGAFKCLEMKYNEGEKSLGRGAVGLNYMYDKIGFQNTHTLVLPVNMQFKLGYSFLSIGVSPGIQRVSFDGEWIPPTTGDDPAIPPITDVSQAKFTMGAGVSWYGKRFSLGISTTHLNEANFSKIAYQSRRHYYLNGSYELPITRKFRFLGVTTVRTDASITSANGMVYGVYGYKKKQFSLGAGYRSGGSLLVALTARFQQFYVGYFMDYYHTSVWGTTLSHEFRLAFEIFDKDMYPYSPQGNPSF